MTELSFIIVNWNCLAFTEQCIDSIFSNVHGIDYEVIVVDNDSADAPCHRLVERFPSIKLVLSEHNIGFGRANNLGVKYATGKSLLFINPDTLVLGDAVGLMISALNSVSRGGAIGCKLLNPDGSLQATCIQPFPTIMNQLLALNWLQRRWPSLPLWGKQALYRGVPGMIHEVDAVSGAAILVQREAFEAVNGFSPEYFMYAEEVDLCCAIHRQGWKILHTSDAQIIHFGGQSTKNCEDDFASVTMRDSIYRFMRRNRGWQYAMVYRVTLFLSAVVRTSLLACVFPVALICNYPFERASVGRAFRKWLKIARWSLRWERSAHESRPVVTARTAQVED